MFRNTVKPLGAARADQLIDVVMNLQDHSVAEIASLATVAQGS
jgi:hypothetical protein